MRRPIKHPLVLFAFHINVRGVVIDVYRWDWEFIDLILT